MALEKAQTVSGKGTVIAVPVLGRIANFDDLDPLRLEPGVRLVFVRPGEVWPHDARLVILPGSKSTIADLEQFRALGWDEELARHVARGGDVLGICGGYQMLGRVVRDPDGIEGTQRAAQGLGLLDIETVLVARKTVLNRGAFDVETGAPLSGYEIHMGRTTGPDTDRPMIHLDGAPDGATSANGQVRGCYLHGLFTDDAWRSAQLRRLGVVASETNYRATIERSLDGIADVLDSVVDTRLLGID